MVQPKDPPARTGLEEAVTALFCLVYAPYQQLNPKGALSLLNTVFAEVGYGIRGGLHHFRMPLRTL
jgi:hypothetical protein